MTEGCKCGNGTKWATYWGMDDRLYIVCQQCGMDYDFELLLTLALKAGVPREAVIRQWPEEAS